jgi:uncharacterized membrane protein
MISFMFLAYAAMALVIVFGIVAMFSATFHKDRKHEWIPTRIGGIIAGIAMILFILAGIWIAIRSLFP